MKTVIFSALLLSSLPTLHAQQKVVIGEDVGSAWTGLPKIDKVVIPQAPPSTAVGNLPNFSKYPIAAGAARGAFTKNLLQEIAMGARTPLRSWLGWFAWGDGLTPSGINPGIYATAGGYGTYHGKGWDFFNFQWPKDNKDAGTWNPIRLDQQPLYLTPLKINYNWAPGLFGYESAPLSNFPNNAFYWKDKKIVRGINVGGAIPFYYQYGDKLESPTPVDWRQSWLYLATRPLETTVIVPSNLPPTQLVNPSGTNAGAAYVPKKNGVSDPFAYPVWRTQDTPADQTPFAILVDKFGDFHADLVWEATNPRESDYDTYRYKRTPFSNVDGKVPMGSGQYLKMTVAQGSPFIWCESNDNAYVNFYNLIRTNIPGQIANNIGTGAGVVVDPLNAAGFNVPGTTGVKFILLYGDHVNPNQWYQEETPWYATTGAGPNDSNLPGGFNPPPLNGTYRAKDGSMISTPGQHNYVYTAIFFRPDEVEPVKINNSGNGNNGTDSQGNPYVYLKFKGNGSQVGKNWFVIGSVPEMRYYGTTPDGENKRQKAAIDWAQRMGKYAFNFPTDSKVSYAVKNMYQTETTYGLTLVNPYTQLPATARPNNPGAMTDPGTVIALQPHQYQPITLGPDYTKTNRDQITWSPLVPTGVTQFKGTKIDLDANKNTKNGLEFWDYWSIRGSLDSVIVNSGTFKTVYPFQNFLPVMPPPKFDRTFAQTGIAAVNVINSGTGIKKITDAPQVRVKTTGTTPGVGAEAFAIVDEYTSSVQQVNVSSGGNQYPNGLPPEGVVVEIDPPSIGVAPVGTGTQATAYPQIGGNSLLAVFMQDKGFGYSSIIRVTQDTGPNGDVIDPPIITPNFDADGNLIVGPANVIENGSGFDFSSTNSPTATLFSGTGSGAVLQIVSPGSILSFRTANGGTQGRYLSPDGNEPTGVTVHVTPPPDNGSAQEATAQFGRTNAGAPPTPTVNNGGLYSGTAGVIAYYTDANGVQSPNLPITWTPSGTNFSISALAPAGLYVTVPTPVTFSGGTAVTPAEATVYPAYDAQPVVTWGGVYSGTAGVTAQFIDESGKTINLEPIWFFDGTNYLINTLNGYTGAWVTSPKDITFAGGSFTSPPRGKIYPAWFVQSVVSGTNLVTGYEKEVQVSFTGGAFSTDPQITMPEIGFTIPSQGGTIPVEDLSITNAGSGLQRSATFGIEGGLGFDAELDPIVSTEGKLIAVRVLRPGSNYLPNGKVFGWVNGGGGSGAQVTVNVAADRSISSISVVNGGSGYTSAPSVILTALKSGNPDAINDNPKGVPSRFNTVVASGTVSAFIKIPKPEDREWASYLAGSENQATLTSTPASLSFEGTNQFAGYQSAARWLATPAPRSTLVEQVLYSSVIAQYFTLSTESVAPFGGAFLGNSAPDGYGLGGQLAGAARFIGDIYNMQQKYGTVPASVPSPYAIAAGSTPYVASGNKTWNFPVQRDNNPYISLTGALQTSVESLQRSMSLLFLDPPSQNNPEGNARATTWKMDYFSQFDPGVGRVVINPTATQPAWGVNSSTATPGDIPDTPEENGSKPEGSLSRWHKGMLWSGFGVSDQWNDQHYFYGYYIGTAALSAVFDRAWKEVPSGTLSEPSDLWAGKAQMGTAIDQLVMTLAYDPDTPALQDPDTGYYRAPLLNAKQPFAYQKFAFFDQWNGHPWATGGTPGTTVAVLDFAADPFGFWRSFGTDSDKYNGENENSAFEGIQAWSSTILWGGATDRKSVVDLGIYLYSTNLAAADAYFLDKNYNLIDSKENIYSWVPVTTIDASFVPKNGNNAWPQGTDYASANPEAFYTAPEFFGDAQGTAAAPGQSLLKKAESTLNNFFYAYPTGSKFIQAYPPGPWTMGMARNTNYMKKWAGAMMRDEWKRARESALYQPADWLAMALTSALAGVPYNPGDTPYPLTGTTPNPKKTDKYLPRLWSSWVTANAQPGAQASLTPPFLANSVLTFLLALDDYGAPDWTYLGVAAGAAGGNDDTSVVFTAAFTKEPQPGDTSVTTTFVAFNPGWNTRYAKFQRLGAGGAILPANVSGLLTVKPKQTVVKTISFQIGTGAPLAEGPVAPSPAPAREKLKSILKRSLASP